MGREEGLETRSYLMSERDPGKPLSGLRDRVPAVKDEDLVAGYASSLMLYPSARTRNVAVRVGPSGNGQLGGKDLSLCLWAQDDRDEEDNQADHSGDEDGTCEGYLMRGRVQDQ